MTIKATIDQKSTLSIFRGEDIAVTFYLYDNDTKEPIDLSSFTTVVICLGNDDSSRAAFTGVVTSATLGKFTIAIDATESALLATGIQNPQLELTDATPDLNVEVLDNMITIADPNCPLV
jgi:hypothetical protein